MRPGGRWRPWLPLVTMLLFGLAAFAAGCRPHSPTPTPKVEGVVKHFGSAPLALELRLDRARLTMTEQLTVALRAETDEAYALKFEEVKAFAGFALVSTTESKPEMTAAGRVAVTRRYLLEPLVPGEATLPVLIVEAWNKSEAQAAITTVRTEPLPVMVESLLAKDDPGQTISDIAPPLAKPLSPWWWVGAGAAGLLLLALILYFWRRWRRRPPQSAPPPLPPHLLAYQALDRLLAEELLARGEVKAFYETLSAILRRYIEQRFGLRAPERTTEEFLAELGTTVGLSSPAATAISTAHAMLLRDFLGHCDLVKFARHTPARAEAEESVERCRRFVRETEPAPASADKPGGAA